MKTVAVACLFLAALAAVQGRVLQQTTYKSVGEALQKTPDLSTLAAAIKASGIAVPDGPITIFAPTNKALASDDVKKATGLTAAQLLEPANKKALVAVLQYHIVPGVAAQSKDLKNGQEVKTALAGAKPLSVKLDGKKVEILADGNKGQRESADVKVADVVAGKAVIHVIDEVLIPASLRKN